MEPVRQLTLLGTAGHHAIDVWVVFRNTSDPRSRAWRLLRRGFQHVEVWKRDRGVWIRYEHCFEYATVHAELEPPWRSVPQDLAPTILRVQRLARTNKLRSPFHVGPITCVDGAKSLLGMWAPLIYTPYQLYRRLLKERQRG